MSKHYALLDLELLDAFDDGLEDLELHGLHSNSGYRKLKKLYGDLLAQPEKHSPVGWTHLGFVAQARDPLGCGRFFCEGMPNCPIPLYAGPPVDVEVSDRLGAWLSAALDDPHAGEDFKRDVRAWFAAGRPGFTLDKELLDD